MARIAFIGLGVMGYPMAGHLATAGHSVRVYNRSADRAERWVAEHGGQAVATPREAAQGADLAFSCVGDDDDVRAVLCGDAGVLAGLAEGAVMVDHTTASAGLARDLDEECRARAVSWLDAPVSGGQAGAENGQLTIMCGGRPDAFAAAEPVMACYARQCRLMGSAGTGQLTKMVNQLCLAGLIQGLAEGLHFARRAGLDAQAVVDVIGKGAAQSWQMDHRHATMLAGDYDHGFAVDWMRKDLAIALEEAGRCSASVPVAALVDQFYAEVQAMGGRRWDTSSLLARLERPSRED